MKPRWNTEMPVRDVLSGNPRQRFYFCFGNRPIR